MSELTVGPTDELPTRQGSLNVFRYRDFRVFFIAASISNGGSWMQLVSVQALMYKLTERGTWLGVSTVATLLPAVLLTPYAGVLADRVSRQAILKLTQTAQMITAAIMWALYVGGSITPWWIVILGFGNGIATGFQTSAWQSFVPLLVPPNEILQAVRLNSTQYTVARAVGPGVGAFVVAIGGIGAAILFNAVTFVLVIGALFSVSPRVNPPPLVAQGIWAGLAEGARYMWSRRPLRLAVLLAFVVSMLGQSIQYIASAVAQELFQRSPESNGTLVSALGAGALASSLLTVAVGERIRRTVQVFCGLGLYVASILLLASTDVFAVGALAYFLAGCGHLLVTVALNTLLQGTVPDEYRGRVLSFYLLGILAGIPIGSQLLGTLGDVVGFRQTILLDAGAFLLLIAVLVGSGWWRFLQPQRTD